jgi:hypothetical protein
MEAQITSILNVLNLPWRLKFELSTVILQVADKKVPLNTLEDVFNGCLD